MISRKWQLGWIGVLIALDQLTKLIAAKTLIRGHRMSYLWDLFRIEYAENRGAFLSLGAGLSDNLRFWIFTVMVSGVLAGAVYYLFKKKHDTFGVWALVMLIGGGVGNLIDRAVYGYVVDFLNLGIGNLRTGIFNIADMAIMAGIGLLLFSSSANGTSESKT